MDSKLSDAALSLLKASIEHAQLPIFCDSEEAAKLLCCSKAHVESLADRGRLPGAKYGRSWIFVTAQLVLKVAEDCQQRAAEDDSRTAGADSNSGKMHCPVKPGAARALVLQPTSSRPPGRPRKPLPAGVSSE